MRMTHPARIGQAFAIVTVLSSAATAIPGWSVGQTLAGVPGSPLAVEPMTKIGAGEVGYFEDPYPVSLAPSRAKQGISFSGTTQAVMHCDYPLSAGCFSWTPARISAGTLSAQIAAAGDQFTNFQNLNVFQADDGRWHAVLAIGVRKPGATSRWTVLVHAHPTESASPDRVPLAWTADTLLPARNGRYRKVLQTDVAGVWGQAGRPEVHYLLQLQQPAWPNYTPGQVFGPGVASALRAPDGAWDLFFAGYDYADHPIGGNPADAHHRRPYFVLLRAAVPAGKSVSTATDAELAGWLEPETR